MRRKSPLYSNIKQENNFYANTSNQEVPQSSLNQPSHYIDPLTHHLYDNPNLLRQTIIRLDSDADEDSDNNPLSPGASDNEIEEEPPEPNNNPVEQEQIAPPVEQPQEPNNNPVEPEQVENLNNVAPVVNHPVAHNANMEHFPHLYLGPNFYLTRDPSDILVLP